MIHPFPTYLPPVYDPLWPDASLRMRLLMGRIDDFIEELERPVSALELLYLRGGGIGQPTAAEISFVLRMMARVGWLEEVEIEETRHLIGGRTMTVKSKMWRVRE